MNIHFLGDDSMTTAIADGLIRQGGHRMHIASRGKEKCEHLAEELGVSVSEKLPELTADGVLILAIKPQNMQAVCQDVQIGGALALSVAAGLGIATLSRYLGGTCCIVRVMPNTSGKIGLEISGMFADDNVSGQDKAAADSIMRTVGITVWPDGGERLYDVTDISGSGPACVFCLLDVLKQAARQQGFDEKEAHKLSLATFKGTVVLANQTGEDFAVLQQNVTSRSGTTHEAIETFEAEQVVETVVKDVTACASRSWELTKQFGAV